MDDTGLLRTPLVPIARRIVFARQTARARRRELEFMAQVDRAHLVMLARTGILDRPRAIALLTAIDALCAQRFAPLLRREATRGLYLLYEDYLIETAGAPVAGMLQLARSRNDLHATIEKLRLRQPYLRLLRAFQAVQHSLLTRATRFRAYVMPMYTHARPAVPGTYGHYLAAVAEELDRDLSSLFGQHAALQRSPLGACAIGGTDLPIDTALTARLLGFRDGPTNSVAAIASREYALRLLAALGVAGVTLSRLATDMLQWTTIEFGFLRLPDDLSGSSSAMPHKRNPFLLEHVQGKTATLLGAFVSSATAMHAVPYQHTIAVGTEALAPMIDAFSTARDAAVMMRLLVRGARPVRAVMAQRAVEGCTTAAALATHLTQRGELDFRGAHHLVGAALRTAFDGERARLSDVCAQLARHGLSVDESLFSPAAVVSRTSYGGGPAVADATVARLAARNNRRARRLQALNTRWRGATRALDDAVADLCGASS